MKYLTPLLLLALACRETPPPVTETVDTRQPVAIKYVGAPELVVREQPNDAAAEVARYSNGESISILVDKGEWVEVRTGIRSGWAKAGDLTDAEGKTRQEESPEVRFKVMPLPVSAPGAKGNVYIEADVNTDGDVVNTKILMNTTGSELLARQNADALRSAKFHPIIKKGERQVFKYYHSVTY